MIYKIINEFTVATKIGSYKLNISDERGPHGRRIKLVGGGVSKGKGTTIPVPVKIKTFDELESDKHINVSRMNDSDKYVKHIIGFIVLNHILINNYFNAVDVDDQNMIYELQRQINNSFVRYLNTYSDNDISRIRKDANAYALQMRAQGY